MKHWKHQNYANLSQQEEFKVLFQSTTGKGQQGSHFNHNNWENNSEMYKSFKDFSQFSPVLRFNFYGNQKILQN